MSKKQDELPEDIDSLIIHSSTTGKDYPKMPPILEDEWYLVKVEPITKAPKPDIYGNVQLRWFFELQGDDFEYEHGGKTRHHNVIASTSTLLSPKTRLGEWYMKIMNVEGLTGKEKVSALANKLCYIMIEKSPRTDGKGDYYFKIKLIKPYKATTDQPTVEKKDKPGIEKQDHAKVNPDGEKTPSDINFTAEETELFKGIV